MKVGKPKSKRVPVRLRHKIEKASAAKQRKQRKEAKKNPQWRSRLKKDPGIPNLFPHKDKVLAEIEEGRRRKEEEAVKRRELAKARRQGLPVDDGAIAGLATAMVGTERPDADADEDLIDVDDVDADEEMDEDAQNPMAALLASAQARAKGFGHEAADLGSDEDDEDEDEDDEWEGVQPSRAAPKAKTALTPKVLPKQALEDPIKAVTVLLERLQQTMDGMQKLLDYYQIPPLVTAGSDTTTRFLVEVARKRGRLGRGGIPNLPAAALTVLADLNEDRLQLPAAPIQPKPLSATNKGEVRIVSDMAEPFRIEGLFGDAPS